MIFMLRIGAGFPQADLLRDDGVAVAGGDVVDDLGIGDRALDEVLPAHAAQTQVV